jgi:spore coat polysaccharide biosynthesis predicted glycosyltransferase SpsG
MSWAEAPVIFRAPAGPRRGFGHLLRCRALARAIGISPLVALRGTPATRRAARRLGVIVLGGSPATVLRRTRARLVVVDDPVASTAARWIAAARRCGCRVVSVHDLGLGCLDADLVIDGSVTRRAPVERRRALAGLRYAVLDPSFGAAPPLPVRLVRRVLVSLGGGPRRRRALAIARAIAQRLPWATVRVVGGFGASCRRPSLGVQWTGPVDGLRAELLRCDLAVVAGGVSLYEACAAGVPAVAVPVVRPQAPAVRAFARRGACRGVTCESASAEAVARVVAALARNASQRRALARSARRLVDGRGAARVAEALSRLMTPGLTP